MRAAPTVKVRSDRVQTQPACSIDALLERSRKLIDCEDRDDSAHNSSMLNPMRSERLKKHIPKIKQVKVEDVLDVMNYGQHHPKIHVVINYGDKSVLPDIVEICNKEQQSRQLPSTNPEVTPKQSPVKTAVQYTQRTRIHSEPTERELGARKVDLLKQCSRQNSYVTYKKNRKSLFTSQTRSSVRKALGKVRMPEQIQKLKSLLFPNINRAKASRESDGSNREQELKNYLKEERTASRIIDTTKLVMREDSPIKDFLKESRRQQKRLNEIDRNFHEAMENGFPPLLLASVIRHLNESQSAVNREMESDILKEEKQELYKKFDRMIENEHLTYKSHIRHILDYKRRKIRDAV